MSTLRATGLRPTTVAEALRLGREWGVARLDAQALIAHQLGKTRSWVLAHDDATLDTVTASRVTDTLARRAAGEPLAYLVGEREFRGLRLTVTAAVLVPRPETEALVDWALDVLGPTKRDSPEALAADLGTGSGAIALALKAARPATRVTATDRSAAALAVAWANAARLGLEVEFIEGYWFEPLIGRRFDLIVSNPPYVATGDPHLPALRHEPLEALVPDGDDDGSGLQALRTIVSGAPHHLVAGGWLLLEHGHDQGSAVAGLMNTAGFTEVQTRPDLAGLPRLTGGHWPG